MGKSKLSLSLVCALIVFSVVWKPTHANEKCSIGCQGTPSAATFLANHKYNYAVEGVVSVFLTGADKQETSVKLLGQVSVSSLGNCAYVLRTQNLVISGPDGKKYPKPEGLEKPVRFTLQDGRIGTDICTEEGDTRRSLNIKRAIISMLQTSTTSRSETDIFGICPTDVSSSPEGNAIILHRARDLSRCGHREHGRNDLVTAVYNPTAEIKSTPILQSRLNVESKVVQGVPEKVSASEEYLYKPFSVGENGARAKVNTKLTLTGKVVGPDVGNFVEARTIIFENPHGVKNDQSNLQNALTAVKDTAKVLTTEASSKSAGLFAQLVRIFRSTNKDDLMKVYAQVRGNNLEKRVFMDGLLRTGTGDSIEVSIQILKSKDLSPLEEKLVYLSFGGAKHVSKDALKSVATLVNSPNVPKEVYLGVGALASTYCRSRNCHVGRDEGVVAISNNFASKLNCKAKTKPEEDVVVAVLKGIRNIRHLEDNVIEKLIHCATDNAVKARVRVAALEAFLADPCSAKIKKTGIDLMKNPQLDSEIRIKAFLAVIGCPCGASANEIKNLLTNGAGNQVGRFISSTLRALRTTANPDKMLARQHYGLIGGRFSEVDDRKYSFYRELSYNIDALGIGGNVDETIIYSQDSFLPRSVSFNLTAEIFGHNLNVFEVGGRQGNLDRVMEHFLGPRSALRTKKPQDIYDDLVKRYSEVEKKVEGKVRGRRSVKSDIDNFDKHIKAESTPYDNELDMDIYVKLFGTDAVFLSLGDDKGFDYNKIIDEILTYVETGINKAKRFQEEVRAHVLFLDAELAYATSTGLPLKLNLVGSATGRLEVSTNIDIRQILRNPNNAKLDVKLVPSTDVEIAGLFYVDANVVSTGLKVVANLHSSTGGQVVAKVLENGQGFDLQIGLPIERQEVVTASSDLFYFTAEKGQKEKEIPVKTDVDRKEYTGCFDQLAGVVGLTACGEVSVPFSVSGPEAQASLQKFFARYPLTGSAKVKLVLEKNDLRGYHIKGLARRDQPQRMSFELLFEAEGSKNRKTGLSGELVNTAEERSISLKLDSPIKTLHGQILLLTKPSEYVALVKAKMDKEDYFARAGFNVQGNDQRRVFTPVLEYQLPGEQSKKSIKVDGQVVREMQGEIVKFNLNGIKVNMPNNEVVDINGDVLLLPKGLKGDIKAKKGEQNMLLSASVSDYDSKIEFQNTLNPNVNFKLAAHSKFEKGLVHNDIDLHYGDFKNSQNRVTINQLLKHHRESSDDFGLITKNKLHIHALPFLVKFDAEVDPKKLDVEMEGQYTDQKALFDLEARTEIKKPGDYSVKMIANVNNKGVEAFAKRDIVSDDKSNLENYITVKNVGKYELSGVVMHKMKSNDINVGAVGHLKISGGKKNEDIKFDIGVIENGNLYSSHAKISQSNGDLVDFLLKVNRGANPNGQLKLLLKDTIAANGQFKVTDADGKGNGMIIIEFKKSQKKFKGDVKFTVKDPVCNVDLDLFLNFEKDNADKIHFSTNTKHTEKNCNSKNKLEYAGKKFELNLQRNGEFELEGKFAGNVEVLLPTERALSFKINREMATKDHITSGNIELVLKDEEKRGGPASSLSYKAKMSNVDLQSEKIKYEGQLSLKLKDGRNLENSFSLSDGPDRDLMKYAFKTELTGSLISKPVTLDITSDRTNPVSSHTSTKNKYRVKMNYGSDIGIEVNGDGELAFTEKNAIKSLQENAAVQIHLPFEKSHDIKAISNIKYVDNRGNGVFEYTITESLQVNADLYKLDSTGKFGPDYGTNTLKVLVPHADPFSIDTSLKADLVGNKKTGELEVKTTYGKGKTAYVVAKAFADDTQQSISVKAHAPQAEKLKTLEVSVTTKNLSPNSYNSLVVVDADGRVYKSDATVVMSKVHPLVDLKYTSPSQPKASRLFLKGDSMSSNQGKVEIKIENVRDLSLDATTELAFPKDDILLKVTGNSEKLGLKDYKVELSVKDVGANKRLELHATNGGKNVLSGSTSFIVKEEGPKTIIEGSGSVKVREEQKSANFKYIRTLLTEGAEQGIETFTNVAIGDRSYVAETRVTNLEYKNSYVYCEEKKQCANAELHTKINVQKPGVLQHTLNMGFDLRKLGFAPEFGLLASSEISEQRLPQYTLDVHVNNEEKKYHLHAYSHPEHGKFPAGVTVALPKRILALETIVSYPKDKAMPFPLRGELSMNLDKNKPQQKTAARFLVDVTGNQQLHEAVAEVGFSHPKLGKEAVLQFRSSFKVPSKNEVVIMSAVKATLPSIGERLAQFQFQASPVHIKIYLDSPMNEVINLEGQTTLKDNLQQAELKVSLLGGKPVTARAVAKDFQYFEFSTGYSDDSQRLLSIIGHIEPEKRVDISADIVLPNEKKNIIHGALYLQDNMVKSDYGISKDNFNYFVNALKNDLATLENRVKELADKANKEFKSSLSKAEPQIKQLQEAYKREIGQLLEEIANDKGLKEFSEVLDKVVQFVASIISDIMKVTEPIVDEIRALITDTSNKIKDLYEKKIEGELKQLYASIASLVRQASEGLIDVVAHFAAVVTDFFEKHKPEFQELANTIAEIFKDLTRLIVVQLKEFRGTIAQISADALQQFKDLPLFAVIKEKFQDLAVPEQVLGLLSEAFNIIRPVLPTEETKVFADTIHNYVQKKLRQEKVDDVAELRVVYEKFALALTSLVQFVRQQLNMVGVPTALNFNVIPMLSLQGQSVPALGGVPAFSVLTQILEGDFPNPIDLIRAYRPRSLNPLEELPAKLRGVVVNGQHIFTFDGRHLTFPGSCRYVLAHDHVDRNFSLVMQLQNGQPKGLLLEDKSGTTIELKDNGQVTLNGAAHGHPVETAESYSFRMPDGRVGLGTEYGVKAFCTINLSVCLIEVSGFYHAKLRGLLGDGNNEPSDDFRLPNGKIVKSEAEFGNAYRLSSSCAQVTTPEHSTHQHYGPLPAACEKVFGSDSALRPIQIFLDVAPFRQACIHAATGDDAISLQQACDLARGYVSLATTGLLPAVLPTACVQCTDGDKPREFGDSYTLNVPGKQADVVIAVEKIKSNEKTYRDMVVPLVGQIVDGLKAKHVTDIKVYLVGISPKLPYPYIYDTDNKLKNAKITFDAESRYEDLELQAIKTGVEKIDKAEIAFLKLIDDIKIGFGLTNVVEAYSSILELPLRPGAIKHTVSVVSEPCTNPIFIVEFLRAVSYGLVLENNAYTHSLITITPDMSIGAGKKVEDVIGYDSDVVLLLGGPKNIKEMSTIRETLDIREDACIDFVELTDGMIFSSTNFAAADAGKQKQFLQTISANILERMSEPKELECVCTYVTPFSVQSICVSEDKEKVPARRRK